ncbi:exosome complex component RRP46 [Phymastichus coffea]|uniref:exosome complex component RRP46 n=1 Tax=Phymastichus coffea TaxID=108790 RepID=UPI00273CE1B1|nr:exosome complex component RRP46 [Phymastichus coffea]
MTETECSIRPLNCELNYLSVPDGSTMFMQGDTSVIAGIYGPIEAKERKIIHNKATVEATFAPIKGPPSINDRFIELYIKDTCEGAIITSLYPASTISINIQELQDCGSLLACVINASCLALINSSLSMKFTFAAICCMIDKESDKIIIDPNTLQLQNAKATFTCTFDSINKELVCCQTSGQFSEEQLLECVDKCKEASQYIFDFYREAVKKYMTAI